MKYSTVRIIGGKFRGRQLDILQKEGLRPTTDRIRESIFNILGSNVQGAKVLDLFAGTGVLGIEAISRGASELTSVEFDKENYQNLKRQFAGFDGRINLIHADAIEFLKNCSERFDIVFLDPPFASNLLQSSIDLLNSKNIIDSDSLIYIESSATASKNYKSLMCVREQNSGNVYFGIYKKSDCFF